MPPYLTDTQIWIAIWPIIAFAVLSSLALTWLSSSWAIGRRAVRRMFVVVFAFSLLGIVTGQVTGLSRVAAVGAVLPAVLSLIGGVLIYLIGTKGPRTQAIVAVSIVGMTINLLIGVYWGSKSRVVFEQYADAPNRVLAKRLAQEEIWRLVALRKLKNYSEIARLHKMLEKQEGVSIPSPIPEPIAKSIKN